MNDLPDAPWLTHEAGLPDAPWARTEQPPHGSPAPEIGYGLSAQVIKGIPVIGGLAQKGAAAATAALDPAVAAVRRWRGVPELPNTQGDFGARYSQHLGELRGADTGFEERHPIAAPALQIAGGAMAFGNGPRPTFAPTAVIPPTGPIVTGSRLSGVGYQAPVGAAWTGTGGTTLTSRMANAGAFNAVLGGADAATRDQDIATGALQGGAIGAAGPLVGRAVGAGQNWWRGNSRASRVAPTVPALEQGADRGFDAARASGLVVHPAGIADLSNIIEHDLLHGAPGAGTFHPQQAPEAFQALREMRQPPPATPAGSYGTAPLPTMNTDANGLINLRERLQSVANSLDPRERMAAGYALNRLDNYLESIPNHHVLAGNADVFRTNYAGGRANYGAAKRSERFSQDVLENASRNADVAHAGENLGNNTRQRLNAYIKSNQRGTELGRGANEDEIAAADRVARGTGFANAARRVQSWTGGLKRGSVASLVGGLVGSSHGPLGAAIGATVPHAVSDIARRAAEASTVRGARGVDEMLRMRSPLGQRVQAARNAAGRVNDTAMRHGALTSRAASTPIAQMLQQQYEQD